MARARASPTTSDTAGAQPALGVTDSHDLRDAGGVRSDAQWGLARKDELALDYTERLRRLAINDVRLVDAGDGAGQSALLDPVLDPRTRALVRLAALVAAGAAVPSYGAQADAALDAGATPAEIVDVLFAVVPFTGLPRAVAAAPELALALGYDTNDA